MRILIVRLGALGDLVHALPVVAALRTALPDARIDWLVETKHRALLDLVDGLSHVVAVRPSAPRGDESLRAAVPQLRAARYDVCLDLQGLVKSALLARASGARRVIGFPSGSLREPAARALYGETAGRDTGHVIDKNLSVLEALDIRTAARRFPLRREASPVPAAVRVMLRGDGVADRFIVLNPGAAWPNKRWPADRFAELAARVRRTHGLRSVVLWGPREDDLAAAVAARSQGAACMAPATAILDVVALAREAALVVSGDTGPLHLAAAVGAPIVGLYSPTDPSRNGPWDADDEVVSRYAVCNCHFKRRCTSARWCLEDLSVDDVEAAVARRFNPGAKA
jgi:lipopolysaccharide heptosyltransferase I